MLGNSRKNEKWDFEKGGPDSCPVSVEDDFSWGWVLIIYMSSYKEIFSLAILVQTQKQKVWNIIRINEYSKGD